MTATPGRRGGGALRLLSPLLLALLAACAGNRAPAPPAAQPSTGSVDVIPVVNKADALLTVSPDRADWLYPLGAQASIRVRLALAPYPAAGVPVKLRLGPDTDTLPGILASALNKSPLQQPAHNPIPPRVG